MAGAVEGTTPLAERSLITSRVGTSSGGINTAALSRNTGGGGWATARHPGGEPGRSFGAAGGAAQRSGESDKPSRSRDEIERMFDRNKGAIYTLYNARAAREPGAPRQGGLASDDRADGRVTVCEMVSSRARHPDLEQKLVQRVLLFQFDAEDVEAIMTTKPIHFFPA